LDLAKYVEGEHALIKKDIDGRLRVARAEVEYRQAQVADAERRLKAGTGSEVKVKGAKWRLERASVGLEKAQAELRLLKDFTHPRLKKDLESRLEEANRALERIKMQAQAKETQADADRKARKAILLQEEAHLKEIEEKLKKGR